METGAFQGFEITRDDRGVAWIRFNTPERLNGLNGPMKRDLIETMVQAQMDDAVRVVVFTGSGRAFSAGDDITGRRPDLGARALMPPLGRPAQGGAAATYAGLRAVSQALNTAVRNLDKITVAAINGFAIQSGLSLALSCDFRLAAQSARLGSATLRFAYQPDEGGHYLLLQHLGLGRALDFMLRNRIVGADDALALGLVHAVVPDAELDARTTALAHELADGPQVAMRLLKRAIYNATELPWERALDDIATKTAITDHLPDAREGVAAFREKRRARFNQG